PDTLEAQLDRLSAAVAAHDHDAVIRILHDVVPEYRRAENPELPQFRPGRPGPRASGSDVNPAGLPSTGVQVLS
ncbi:MAG TPA: hypothetical protein VGD16_05180, partial [Enterovirga sp.]